MSPAESTGGADERSKRTASRYERQCRRLLAAFPADFRRDRGDDLLATLLDDAPGAAHVSLLTAADLVAAGTRMRARRAGADRDVRHSVGGGVGFAAVAGLGLQAALAVAAAVYFVAHRALFDFYLHHAVRPGRSGFTAYNTVWHWLSADFPVAWIGLAAACVLAFVAGLRGRLLAAGVLSALAATYLLVVTGVSVRPQQIVPTGPSCSLQAIPRSTVRLCAHPETAASFFAGNGGQFMHSPAVLAIAVVATAAALFAARTHRHPAPMHTWGWLAPAAALTMTFVAVADGRDLSGLTVLHPLRQGGVLVAMEYLWVVGAMLALLWCWFDPRAGWAAIILSVPFVVFQLTPRLTYGVGSRDHPSHVLLALMAAGAAMAILSTAATTSGRRLRRE